MIDPPECQVPCAIVLVGHNQAGVVDAYGASSVVILDILLNPIGGAIVKVGFSACCPTIALMDVGPWSPITDEIYHPHPKVSTPDENGAAGAPGVDITDLSVFISDKSSFFHDMAQYRQRSDFDFHLPVFNCWSAPSLTQGLGDNLGDLSQWVTIKSAAGSFFNGPFPTTCLWCGAGGLQERFELVLGACERPARAAPFSSPSRSWDLAPRIRRTPVRSPRASR
jgi:hypothetical protein